jgi:hypothetical protein
MSITSQSFLTSAAGTVAADRHAAKRNGFTSSSWVTVPVWHLVVRQRGYGARVLTILTAAASSPSADWTSFLAPAGTLLGVVVGGVLVPAFEPIKLGAAHRAYLRKERLAQSVRLIQAARQAQQLWRESLEPRVEGIRQAIEIDTDRPSGRGRELRAALNELRDATMLLKLYGPDFLADKAQAVTDAEDALIDRGVDGSASLSRLHEEMENRIREIDAAVDVFVDAARKHTR